MKAKAQKVHILEDLDQRRQRLIGEVPSNMTRWLKKPSLEYPPAKARRGRPLRHPRVATDEPKATRFKQLLAESPKFIRQRWERYRVKDGDKGPMIWEVKHASIYCPEGKSIAAKRWHLLIARNPLKPDEIKYFLSNAPASNSYSSSLSIVGASSVASRIKNNTLDCLHGKVGNTLDSNGT